MSIRTGSTAITSALLSIGMLRAVSAAQRQRTRTAHAPASEPSGRRARPRTGRTQARQSAGRADQRFIES